MSLFDILKATTVLIKGVYQVAVFIHQSDILNEEFKEAVNDIITDLSTVGNLVEILYSYAQRVSVQSEQDLIKNIEILQILINDAKSVLEEVQHDRNLIQRFFMKKEDYLRKLRNVSRRLHETCATIRTILPTIRTLQIGQKKFEDFRKLFQDMPEKSLSFYDFSITQETPVLLSSINLKDFDTTKRLCYLKLVNDKFFFVYKLRTWFTSDPKPFVLIQRKKEFRKMVGNASSASPTASSPPSATASTDTHEKLDFSEFFMSHEDICGIAVTQSCIYIATKHQITIATFNRQRTIAQYGTEGNGPNAFGHISSIYIPPKDEENLYIVDRGQRVVHHYKIDSSGHRFEFVRQYIVIADVNQRCNLVSCTIFNRNLYVSDDGNNCLHVFGLNKERQLFYLTDNLITPFSPGSLYAHDQYLYVANGSEQKPGILVFDEECHVVDWFCNESLKEILAFDIDPHLNELYIVTTTEKTRTISSGIVEMRKEPLIVSMTSIIREKNDNQNK